MVKKLLSVVLSLLMLGTCFSVALPAVASAAEIDEAWEDGESGACGNTSDIETTNFASNDDTSLDADTSATETWYTPTVQEIDSSYVSNNESDNNYSVWSSIVKSYLYENNTGNLVRVEYYDSAVVVEEINSSGKIISSQTIECELTIFGGFYHGENYNFLVFGQTNYDEDDECEVMRIVKYSTEWERLGSYSVYGANTYIPFDAGSLRMTETDESLYIYTCHEMYESSDGYHHQANMTFVINQSDMSLEQSYYNVMNISHGYVSHSFNQFIQTDGDYIYRVDHGDAYLRAVSITRCAPSAITSTSYTRALSIQGTTGANATGVSVGGFELSNDNCIIAGNSVDQSDSETYDAYSQRNIFVTITDKDLNDTNIIWLTDYTSSDNITPRTPQLVKLNDEQFLVLWEEYNGTTKRTTTKIATIDADGNVISTAETAFRLSDCRPILTSDGTVCWYVSDGSNVTLYTIDPNRIDEISKWNYRVLDDGTAQIIGYAYSDEETIEIPSEIDGYTVTSIGDSVFYNCTSLTSVTIPDSVTSIGNYVFWNCTNLESITLPDSVTSLGSLPFYNCTSLISVIIGNGITAIDSRTFSDCTSLKSVIIGNSVESIGSYAFSGCTALESIEISDTVTSIDNKAFSDCSIKKIVISYGSKSLNSTLIVCKDTVESIEIPNSVTSIEDGTFEGCTSLENITVSEGNENYTSIDGVLFDKDVTKIVCYPLGKTDTTYTIPDSITNIEDYTFSGAAKLTSVIIGNSVESIGSYAFSGCTALKSIEIPKSVTSIGDSAFYNCTNLTDVYYGGSIDEWNEISIASDNSYLTSANTDYANTDYTDANTGIMVTTGMDIELVIEQISDSATLSDISSALTSDEKLIAVYDISLTKDGSTVEPEEIIRVKIPTTDENAKVYVVEEDGTLTDLNAEYSNGYMIFRTDNLSRYALAGDNTTEPSSGTTDPAESTDPSSSTTDPTESTDLSSDTTDPTESTNPSSDTTDPSESTEPSSGTTDPTESTEPTTGMTDPTESIEPTTEATEPTTSQTKVNVSAKSKKLYVKGTYSIKPTVENASGTTTYTSSNSKIASVSSSGKVTAKKKGTATITVTNNGVSTKVKITVKNPKLNKKSVTLKKGKSFKLKITGLVGKAKFKSNKKKVAKINSKGKITAKKKGKATIIVKANGIKLKCTVKVS